MSVKTVRDLNATSRSQFDRAKTAAQSKNYDYAITLCQALLKDEPLFLDGRKLCRTCGILKYKTTGTLTRQMANMRTSTLAMKLSTKKNPNDQLIAAEEILAVDPYNYKANAAIGDAGIALGSPEIKCFAFENLAESKADAKAGDKSALPILRILAEAYMEAKTPEKAIGAYERILEIDPRDGDALSGLKNAEAAKSHEKWDKAEKDGDFRDALADKKEAETLEQKSKIVKSTDAIEEQIQANYAQWQTDRTNPVYAKTIAALYLQRNEFAHAIPWYQEAFEAGNRTDPSLEKTIGDLKIRAGEAELRELKGKAAEEADPEVQAQLNADIQAKETELNGFRLELAEARVRAQPNEGEFRFDLGEALFHAGQYKRATEELQQAINSQPSVRYRALNMLGLSFMKRGMVDFAINRLSLAESELPDMKDDIKKQVTYNLGLAYEANKQPDKALDQWKKIYEVDMSYSDVAARVEASYGGDGAN